MTKQQILSWVISPTAQTVGFVLGGLIIGWSTLTPAEFLPAAPGSDKLHHVVGFGGWALMCAFGPIKRFMFMALAVIVCGGLIELIQPYVNRYGEWFDFYADAAGVLLAVALRLTVGRSVVRVLIQKSR
ncbi:hypothetical protein [Marinomonas sp. IMCC 4694]|uniref:hypothetical protein n=1 Tax=Marinomonas sp. IMCC 4694 TaxID=2605432 RepID=UPI0011E77776|nr:hypothetical protein [Marinomonas sp. IMCC 4694]TYL48318.1 hypothetical protein FXV75_10405 [Marinomonas sp. IMCC 4694]